MDWSDWWSQSRVRIFPQLAYLASFLKHLRRIKRRWSIWPLPLSVSVLTLPECYVTCINATIQLWTGKPLERPAAGANPSAEGPIVSLSDSTEHRWSSSLSSVLYPATACVWVCRWVCVFVCPFHTHSDTSLWSGLAFFQYPAANCTHHTHTHTDRSGSGSGSFISAERWNFQLNFLIPFHFQFNSGSIPVPLIIWVS